MNHHTLIRLGGLAAMATAVLFAIGGVLVVVVPGGGLSTPAAPLAYYLGLVLATLALIALYVVQYSSAGKLGFSGFVLAFVGAVLYSAPAYALVAGTAGVQEWHSIWGFAMSNVLSLGGSAFLLGLLLLGIATRRSSLFSPWAGLLLATGAGLWLLAFWGLAVLLAPASLLVGLALFWMGTVLFSSSKRATAAA